MEYPEHPLCAEHTTHVAAGACYKCYMRPLLLIVLTAVAAAQPTDLLQAARAGRTKEIETAIAAGAPVDGRDLSGRTALMLAAENGHAAAVRLLLDRGADPNARDARGWTPYLFALLAPSGDVLRAHDSVLKLLPNPGRFRISLNVMWTPSETAFQSCFLKPELLSRQMRDLRPDIMVLEAFQRFAIAGGRDLVAVVQSDALGTSEVPNKTSRDDVDAALQLTAEPQVTCGYQVDKIAIAIHATIAVNGKEPRTLAPQPARTESAANPRQYTPLLLANVSRSISPIYWSIVAALMSREREP
jgi:hypothetical protein